MLVADKQQQHNGNGEVLKQISYNINTVKMVLKELQMVNLQSKIKLYGFPIN